MAWHLSLLEPPGTSQRISNRAFRPTAFRIQPFTLKVGNHMSDMTLSVIIACIVHDSGVWWPRTSQSSNSPFAVMSCYPKLHGLTPPPLQPDPPFSSPKVPQISLSPQEMPCGFGEILQFSPRWRQESKKLNTKYKKINTNPSYSIKNFLLFIVFHLCDPFLSCWHNLLPFALLTMSGGRLAQLLS